MSEENFEADMAKLLSRYGSESHMDLANELWKLVPPDCRRESLGESVRAALGGKEISESDADKIAVLEAAYGMPSRAI